MKTAISAYLCKPGRWVIMATHNIMTPIPKNYTNCQPCLLGQWGHPTPSLLKNPTSMNYTLQEMAWKVTNKSILDSPLYKSKGPATCENRSSFILTKLSAGQHPGAIFWLIFGVNFRNWKCLFHISQSTKTIQPDANYCEVICGCFKPVFSIG